jgi:hypothetical protein
LSGDKAKASKGKEDAVKVSVEANDQTKGDKDTNDNSQSKEDKATATPAKEIKEPKNSDMATKQDEESKGTSAKKSNEDLADPKKGQVKGDPEESDKGAENVEPLKASDEVNDTEADTSTKLDTLTEIKDGAGSKDSKDKIVTEPSSGNPDNSLSGDNAKAPATPAKESKEPKNSDMAAKQDDESKGTSAKKSNEDLADPKKGQAKGDPEESDKVAENVEPLKGSDEVNDIQAGTGTELNVTTEIKDGAGSKDSKDKIVTEPSSGNPDNSLSGDKAKASKGKEDAVKVSVEANDQTKGDNDTNDNSQPKEDKATATPAKEIKEPKNSDMAAKQDEESKGTSAKKSNEDLADPKKGQVKGDPEESDKVAENVEPLKGNDEVNDTSTKLDKPEIHKSADKQSGNDTNADQKEANKQSNADSDANGKENTQINKDVKSEDNDKSDGKENQINMPIALAQIGKKSLTVKEDEEQKITLLGTNPDGTASTIFKIISLPENGMLKDDKGNIENKSDDPYLVIGDLFYIANSDSAESDSFSFKACDKEGCSDPEKIVITVELEDDPPKFTSKPPKLDSVNEGSQYNARFDIEDSDSASLTAVLEKRPEWLSFANNKDKLRITLTGPSNFSVQLEGTPENKHIEVKNDVKLSIRDDKSSISYQFTIDVANIDNAGFITINGEPKQNEVLKAVLTDDDGIDGQVSYEWKRDGSRVKGVNDSYKLTQADVGAIISVIATYKDSQSGEIVSTSEVKTDQITNINDAPIIKSIPKQTIKLNQRFTYAVKAEDPDGPSELIYSLLNKPVGMAINASTGEITWTPTQTDSNIQVNVQVDDGSKTGNTKDNEMFFITVMGDKDKTKEQPEKLIPSINAIPIASGMDIEAIEQVAKKITLQGSDADNTPEQITYKIVEPPEYGTTTEPNGAVVTYTSTSDTATEDSFTYRVCDEVLCSEKGTVSLSIEPQNDRFKIITTDIAEAIEGAEYYLELKVQDPDSDNLLFTFREKPSWLSFDNNKNPIRVSLINRDEIFATTLKFKGTPQNRHVGENKIKLEITDGFGKNKLVDSHEFTINVSNTDDKGQIEIKGDPKQNETLEATVTDGDGIEGDKISYQWQRGSETIDGAEGPSYMLTQKDVGSIISVNATYTDLRSGIKHSLTKPTDSIENVNDAPTLSGDPDTEVNQDKDYEFTPTVADIDKKDTFTYSIVNQPDWAKFDSSTGTLSGTPKNQHVGTSEGIVISVNDGHGGNAWLPSFNIKVINEDDPPVLQSIDNKSVKEDFERFTIELSATDRYRYR